MNLKDVDLMLNYMSKLEKRCFELAEELYEASFRCKDVIVVDKRLTILNIRLDKKGCSLREVSVFPVNKVKWYFHNETIHSILKPSSGFSITNFRLVKSYIEDLKYMITLEGFPYFQLDIEIEPNVVPVINCKKVYRSNK